ncbi:MAG TPA: sigma-70 family RNA polymerase sigma factor [Bacteroidia bacterium]|jgi:RNA polymerase sigma-70 factor (ECF subfamily)|nr:sigma-70 family RNA polymerase sigma factor [Bacteroidia bacterium]HRG51577.1 sigma-70 family RNA polymerase sigma factor [Bacteroidia bacterium]
MPTQKQFIDDQELVINYINGDETALATLIQRHKRRIFSYIMLTVKDRALAEDIFQDAFFKIIITLKKGSYNEEGKFLPWVLRITHNLIIDTFRRNKRMPTISGGVNDDGEEFDIFSVLNLEDKNVEEDIIKGQVRKDVRKLIDQLPLEQKEVLMMRHYYDMSFKEISEQTNVSINTALGRMRYALINLRKLIDEKEVVISM